MGAADKGHVDVIDILLASQEIEINMQNKVILLFAMGARV
jgi:hypothetical protein